MPIYTLCIYLYTLIVFPYTSIVPICTLELPCIPIVVNNTILFHRLHNAAIVYLVVNNSSIFISIYL